MRIITKGALRDFWMEYADSEEELKYWYSRIKEADYTTPNELMHNFPTADIIGNNRVVFNITGNKYRLIVVVRYKIKTVFIRFIGTHKDYDKIKDIKNI